MKRLLAVLMLVALCWGCSKEQGRPVTSGGPGGGVPLPVLSSAAIVTSDPISANPLSLQFATDSGEARMEFFTFKWYVDGTAVDGVNTNVLEPERFRKGSKVEAEVIATDGTRMGPPFRTRPVTIKNSPPAVTSANIQPVPAFAGDVLSVSASGSDRDNDTVKFEVQWLVNGASAAGNEQGQLSTAGMKKKDRITAMVTPFDGEDHGTPEPTNYLVLSNRNPDITSAPPSGLQNGTLTYQVVAKDEDGDTITYSLVAGPPGMTIDKNTGLIKWDAPIVQAKEQITVKIAADDGDGGVVYQEFSMTLEMR